MATRRRRSRALPTFHPTKRCACGNRLFLGEVGICAACRLVQWLSHVEQTYARRQVGLRERIAARWPGYDAVGPLDDTVVERGES